MGSAVFGARAADMIAPRRLQRSRRKGWRMPPDAIYVGRPGRHGNPFRAVRGYSPATVLSMFRRWLASDSERARALFASLAELRGHDLVCWCRLCARHAAGKPFGEACADCAPCHADTLGALANAVRVADRGPA
jgi:hypothetical protein